MNTGILSTGFAIIAGVLTTTATLPLTNKQSVYEVVARTLFGVLVFVLAAMLTAVLAALWQDYPLGVGSFLR
jgi:hypothetical protein